jgi:hypothetical protein
MKMHLSFFLFESITFFTVRIYYLNLGGDYGEYSGLSSVYWHPIVC